MYILAVRSRMLHKSYVAASADARRRRSWIVVSLLVVLFINPVFCSTPIVTGR